MRDREKGTAVDYVGHFERMQQPPARDDRSWLRLAGEWAGWLPPGRAPRQDPVPARLLDWFGVGAARRGWQPGRRPGPGPAWYRDLGHRVRPGAVPLAAAGG
jgi:hypothetical protein